jgi:hypothetical protein
LLGIFFAHIWAFFGLPDGIHQLYQQHLRIAHPLLQKFHHVTNESSAYSALHPSASPWFPLLDDQPFDMAQGGRPMTADE